MRISTAQRRFAPVGGQIPGTGGQIGRNTQLFFYSPVFEIIPSQFNERYEVVARYSDADILQSGWLIGGDALAGKAAMISAQSGRGKIVLIGFRTQHRAQTHGTFKLLFNALIG